MIRAISVAILIIAMIVISNVARRKEESKVKENPVASIDTSLLLSPRLAYVPVNAVIYSGYLKRPLRMDTELNIRNTSLTDSLYLTAVTFYNLEGKPLKQFVESIQVLAPLSTQKFYVKRGEFHNTGDNFIVEWRTRGVELHPLIKSISTDPRNTMALAMDAVMINPEEAVPVKVQEIPPGE